MATSAQWRNYLRLACQNSNAANLTLEAYFGARLACNPALKTSGAIQSTSHGSQSVTYFGPGFSYGLTADDESTLIDWVYCVLPHLRADLEQSLGRPPTHDELCAELIRSVQPVATQVAYSFGGVIGGCGC